MHIDATRCLYESDFKLETTTHLTKVAIAVERGKIGSEISMCSIWYVVFH